MPALADIPAPVLAADREHHRILEEVPFSRHLNPLNANEARRAFVAQRRAAPPFEYEPLLQADTLLRRLDAVEPPRDHPAGLLVGRCLDGTRAMILALRDRTPERFDALARLGGWYPDAALLALRFPPPPRETEPLDVGSAEMVRFLVEALRVRELHDWRVEEDPVMSARVLVDGAKRLLRVSPDAVFRRRDLQRLVVHEIDVHAWRTRNGLAQPLLCFSTGLPDSLATEEGLAMQAEHRTGLASPGVLYRQVDVVHAIDLARRAGFREVYDDLVQRVGPGLAWGIGLRIKRGLARPELPGVYAKDSVYLRGWAMVGRWLDAGGPIEHLYVGKVGVDDPVGEWIDQGWVTPGPLPPAWQPAQA